MEIERVVEKIGQYWSDRVSTFDKEHDTEDLDAWKATLEKLLGPDKRKSVLDLGTGTGFLCNMTGQLGYTSIGMDISSEMIKYAVRHSDTTKSNAVYLEGSALDLPFADNAVDFIINCRLIWTIVKPDEMVGEWLRVIKTGGKLFCFNRMKDDDSITGTKESIYKDEEIDKELAYRATTKGELEELLVRNGFEDVRVEKLPQMTRSGYDYDAWCVLTGAKPVQQRLREDTL